MARLVRKSLADFFVGRSVVTRMRSAHGLIATLVVLLHGVETVGLNRVQNVQDALANTSLPELSQVEVLEDIFRKTDAAFQDILSAQARPQHRVAQREAVLLVRQLRQAITANPSLTDHVQGFEDLLVSISALTGSKLTNETSIRYLARSITEASEELLGDLETLTLARSAEVEFMLLEISNARAQMDLAQGISDIRTLTQLRHLIERNIDLTSALLSSQTLLEADEIEARLAFNLRATIRELTELGATTDRAEIAAAISAIRTLVLERNGLIEAKAKSFELSERLDRISKQHEALSDEISQGTVRSIEYAKDEIQAAVDAVGVSIRTTKLQSFAMGAAVIAVIALVSLSLVERQIISRLASLTSSVRDIAGGNLDSPVKVTGPDELGEMSRALEVFKGNARELKRSNEELGRFAYAAAHDLKSPLRSIRDLAVWTIEDAGPDMPEDARNNLDMLLVRTDRLSELLNSLLDYSQVGRESANIKSVSIGEIVERTAELLGANRNTSIDYTGFQEHVNTYQTPLRQVLLNLVSNAIKHNDRDTVTITVAATLAEDRMLLSVADDGPGIDPDYHNRVFGLFETLQTKDDVEGSGMGLAIIRKLVEHYGGRIELRSHPAKRRGTTFSFDWPVFETAEVQEDVAA